VKYKIYQIDMEKLRARTMVPDKPNLRRGKAPDA
jgi:hypothetical protein